MLLESVVRTSAAVAGTPGRLAKIGEIAGLLTDVPPAEIAVAVCFLSGDLTQRQIGVGYAALTDLLGGYGQSAPAAAGAGGRRPAAARSHADRDRSAPWARSARWPGRARRPSAGGCWPACSAVPLLHERQFLVRLLAGDLRQGALDGVMTDAIARAAGVPAAEVRRAHQLSGSLAAAAAAALGCRRPRRRDHCAACCRPEVGRPVRPMLAASAPSVAAALDRISPAAVEWKVDGIRVQLHRQDSDVRVFTRTLDDITHRVPEIVAAALTLTATTAVLDGEAVALRPDGRPLPVPGHLGTRCQPVRPGRPGRAGAAHAVPVRPAAPGRRRPARASGGRAVRPAHRHRPA